MKNNMRSAIMGSITLLLTVVLSVFALSAQGMSFPEGTATPSETCGGCHKAIYREFAYGFGSDIKYKPTTILTKEGERLRTPANVSATATAHAFAGVEPYPIHAREAEEEGKSCNVCHFPEPFAIPDMSIAEMTKPKARPRQGGRRSDLCQLPSDAGGEDSWAL